MDKLKSKSPRDIGFQQPDGTKKLKSDKANARNDPFPDNWIDVTDVKQISKPKLKFSKFTGFKLVGKAKIKSQQPWKGGVNMEFEVNTYVGVSKSDPEGEKYKNDLFLYSGHNKKSPFLPDTYLLLEEIQDRVDGNNMERLRMDRAVYQSGESPMCMYNGKAEVDPQGYRKFNSVFDMKPTKNHTEALKLLGSAGSFKMQTEDASEVLRNTFKVYFQFLQGTLQQAQGFTGYSWDVLSRFWDQTWPDSDPLMEFVMVVPKQYIRAINVNGGSPKNRLEDPEFARRIIANGITDINTTLKFKPKVLVIFDNEFKDSSDLVLLDPHPNRLYELYAHKAHEERFHDPKIGIFTKERPRPTKTQAIAADVDLDCQQGGKAKQNATSALVDKASVLNSSNYKRTPDQVNVMNGVSPNEFVRPWWKQEEAKAAEWLHRCAFSFGGLYENNRQQLPNSAQVKKNLVIGTIETNTHMIRQEAFIKRLAQNEAGCKVHVSTTIDYPPEWSANWMKGAQHVWLAPQLTYTYTARNSQVACDRSVTFFPFGRWVATRFEINLDLLIEGLVYGWNV